MDPFNKGYWAQIDLLPSRFYEASRTLSWTLAMELSIIPTRCDMCFSGAKHTCTVPYYQNICREGSRDDQQLPCSTAGFSNGVGDPINREERCIDIWETLVKTRLNADNTTPLQDIHPRLPRVEDGGKIVIWC